jgi:hypothetical protein
MGAFDAGDGTQSTLPQGQPIGFSTLDHFATPTESNGLALGRSPFNSPNQPLPAFDLSAPVGDLTHQSNTAGTIGVAPTTERQFAPSPPYLLPDAMPDATTSNRSAFNTLFSDVSLGLTMPVIGALALDVATRGRYNATGRVFTLYGQGAGHLGRAGIWAIRELGPPTAQATWRLTHTLANAVRQTAVGRLFP